jgi:hypothetical protein
MYDVVDKSCWIGTASKGGYQSLLRAVETILITRIWLGIDFHIIKYIPLSLTIFNILGLYVPMSFLWLLSNILFLFIIIFKKTKLGCKRHFEKPTFQLFWHSNNKIDHM